MVWRGVARVGDKPWIPLAATSASFNQPLPSLVWRGLRACGRACLHARAPAGVCVQVGERSRASACASQPNKLATYKFDSYPSVAHTLVHVLLVGHSQLLHQFPLRVAPRDPAYSGRATAHWAGQPTPVDEMCHWHWLLYGELVMQSGPQGRPAHPRPRLDTTTSRGRQPQLSHDRAVPREPG